jgi:hypothetical protein
MRKYKNEERPRKMERSMRTRRRRKRRRMMKKKKRR